MINHEMKHIHHDICGPILDLALARSSLPAALLLRRASVELDDVDSGTVHLPADIVMLSDYCVTGGFSKVDEVLQYSTSRLPSRCANHNPDIAPDGNNSAAFSRADRQFREINARAGCDWWANNPCKQCQVFPSPTRSVLRKFGPLKVYAGKFASRHAHWDLIFPTTSK